MLIDIGHRLEDAGVDRIIEFMAKHESFASLEEAAVEIAEYLPQRRAVRPESLSRNLRQRPDGRWEWKHGYGKQLRETGVPFGGWRALVAGLDDEVPGLTCPVLVLRGAKSDVLSNEGAEAIAALIPDARLATIGAAGHHAAGDNPESTAGLVRTFPHRLALTRPPADSRTRNELGSGWVSRALGGRTLMTRVKIDVQTGSPVSASDHAVSVT